MSTQLFKPAPGSGWTEQLVFELALMLEGSGESLTSIMQEHEVSLQELQKYNNDPSFRRKLDNYRTEIREKGLNFKLKARTQAEMLLKTSWELIHNAEVSPAVKADLIKSTVRWAGLEQKSGEDGVNSAGGVSIIINLAGEHTPMHVIEGSAREISGDQQY